MSEPVDIAAEALVPIIREEMDLPAERVLIYNQKFKLPTVEDLFVVIEVTAFRVFGYGKTYIPNPDPGATEQQALLEVATTNRQETYTIKLFSRNDDARTRQQELIFALGSTYSQQLQEKYSFKIGELPLSFVDISEVEASARLTTFAYTLNLLRSFERRRVVEYYDKFDVPPSTLLINP